MSRFFHAAGSESSDSESESSGDEEVITSKLPAGGAKARDKFALSDSEGEDLKRIVRTAKAKRYGELRDLIKQIKNSKKIKDMHKILSVFEDLCRAYEKAKGVVLKEEGGVMPRFYARILVELETFVNETWEDREGRKLLSKNNAKGLATLRQKLKKYFKDFETDINLYKEKPDPEGYSSEEEEEEAPSEDEDEPQLKKPAGKAAATAAKFKKAKADESSDEELSWESSSESESELEELEGMAMEKLRQWFLKKAPGEEDEKKKETKKQRGREREDKKDRRRKDQAEVDVEGAGGEDWETVRGGGITTFVEAKAELFPKGTEITHEVVLKKLEEILASRGKKRQDRKELVDMLKELVKISNANNLGAGLAVKIQLLVIAGLFDYNVKISDCMGHLIWDSALDCLKLTLSLVQEHNILVSMKVTEEDESVIDSTVPYRVRGCLLSLFEKLDDEFIKMLQEADCHSTDYVERLKGEKPLCAFTEILEAHLININASKDEICRIYMKRIEHLYYKFDYKAIAKEDTEDLTSLIVHDSQESSRDIIDRLCKFVYMNDDSKRLRSRAMLCQIYHHALHDRWHAARDLLLMSHLQGQIDTSDGQTQILYNRAICQVGLCAFRHGFIREAHNALTDIQSGGKAKELLAQGLPLRQQQERTPEQEKLEKQRQVPYHMHINLELLECVYLICSMLLEIPVMASKEFELKRGRISRSFHYQLKQSERQSLTGPPENTREHVVAAAKALLIGDWKACRDYVVNDKMNSKVWNLFHRSQRVKDMLVRRVQEESLRTYMFTYSAIYDTVSLRNLSLMFELDDKSVHGIISKMIINEELSASLDEPAECVVIHHVEPSRIQTLALQLTEKLTTLSENNEQIMDPRTNQNYQYRPGGYQNWQGQRPQGGQQDYRERRQGQQAKQYN